MNEKLKPIIKTLRIAIHQADFQAAMSSHAANLTVTQFVSEAVPVYIEAAAASICSEAKATGKKPDKAAFLKLCEERFDHISSIDHEIPQEMVDEFMEILEGNKKETQH